MPHFNPRRFEFAIDYVQARVRPGARLIDVGCGDGTTLGFFRRAVGALELTGLDVSCAYLRKARENVACEVVHGSILDHDLVARLADRFDFVVIGSVLHHLIGSTRAASREAARSCLRNAARMTARGGALIVFEPAWQPRIAMDGVFYTKRFFGRFSRGRLELGPSWLNIGEPVVSYYGPAELDAMVDSLPDVKVAVRRVVDSKRAGGILRRTGLGLILEKEASTNPANYGVT